MKNEVWKSITGTKGLYEVSSFGRVKSKKGNKELILKLNLSPHYAQVYICYSPNNYKKRKVHQLVLESFVSKRPKNKCCGHLDGNSLNNNLSNLKWISYRENNLHKVIHGTHPKTIPNIHGEKNAQSKLKNFEVKHIRLWKESGFSYSQIAKAYNVSKSNIANIIKKRSYKFI